MMLSKISKKLLQQAKQAHPDTLGKGRSQQQNDEFAVVLMAYQACPDRNISFDLALWLSLNSPNTWARSPMQLPTLRLMSSFLMHTDPFKYP